jgi:hypothetical protein
MIQEGKRGAGSLGEGKERGTKGGKLGGVRGVFFFQTPKEALISIPRHTMLQ